MVAQVNISKSIRHVLGYNDRKLASGKAVLLHAANFLELPEELDLKTSMYRFNKLAMLNLRSRSNAAHITLNFHPAESEKLSGLLLRTIAVDYMTRIGFAEQPYLVYQHLDAAHPHVHIVSTLIRKDGSRIYTHNINIDQSRKAKQAIEKQYGLIEARKMDRQRAFPNVLPETHRSTLIMEYGKTPTKEGMARIIDSVMEQFHYASFPEFKAALQLYHLAVNRVAAGWGGGGIEEARSGMADRKSGLVYQAMTMEGKKIGMPVKASRIPGNPTLQRVEARFLASYPERERAIHRIQQTADWVLVRPPATLGEFSRKMESERVAVVVSKERSAVAERGSGREQLCYVDLLTRTVIEESSLEERYSGRSILKQFSQGRAIEKERRQEVSVGLELSR